MRTRRLAMLVLVLLSVGPCPAAADNTLSLAQYIALLEQTRASAAGDSAAVSSLAQNLPRQWRLEAGGQTFTVESAGLAQSLRDYAKQRTPANLAAITSQIDLMLADARAMQAARSSTAAEHAKLTEILSRREFQKVSEESWWDRLKRAVQRWFFQLLERILFSRAFPMVSRIIVWVLVAAAVLVAVYWVIRNYRQTNVYTSFTAPPDAVSGKPWRDWKAEAEAAAREGRWREAVHLSYWAAISFLEGQGLWRPDRARTPREYLRLLPKADLHREPLQQLTRSFEKVWYGNDPASAETFAGTTALLEELGCR